MKGMVYSTPTVREGVLQKEDQMDQETRQKVLRKAGIDPDSMDEEYERDRQDSVKALRKRQADMIRRFKGK
jgi:hypothetical protein